MSVRYGAAERIVPGCVRLEGVLGPVSEEVVVNLIKESEGVIVQPKAVLSSVLTELSKSGLNIRLSVPEHAAAIWFCVAVSLARRRMGAGEVDV